MAPILVARLLRIVDRKLIELLKSLTSEEWEKQTIAPRWKVKDVAAHLLDTPLRKLSMVRDGYVAATPTIRSPEDLIAFVNQRNEDGVRVYQRLSTPILISLMEVAVRESADFHESLDPFADAAFNVSWAGESVSSNWFDTAREFTERWHHQQQIRLAVGIEGIMTPDLYHPVLDCFLRALPYWYRNIESDPGTAIEVKISGDCGGTWYLERVADAWRLYDQQRSKYAARVTIPQNIAWRVFTKGIERSEADELISIEGDRGLGLHLLGMTAIVG